MPIHSPRAKTMAALAICIAGTGFGSAFAGTLYQQGSPEVTGPISSYGMQVPVDQAIHTALPKGWSAIVAPDLPRPLPGKVSWAPSDTWLDVMSRIADRTDAGFTVDWTEQKVIVKAVSGTMQDAAQREQFQQAASTPLPTFGASSGANPAVTGSALAAVAASGAVAGVSGSALAAAPVVVAPAVVVTPAAPQMAQVQTPSAAAPTPAPSTVVVVPPVVVAQAQKPMQPATPIVAAPVMAAPVVVRPPVVVAAAVPAGNPMPTTAPTPAPMAAPLMTPAMAPEDIGHPVHPVGPERSFYAASAKAVFETVAEAHGLTLSWQGPDFHLPGPVTVTYHSTEEDVDLIARALGSKYPLAVMSYADTHELVVMPATRATYDGDLVHPQVAKPATSLWARTFHHSTPSDAMTSTSMSGNTSGSSGTMSDARATMASDTGATASVPVMTPAPVRVSFDIKPGDRLSIAITSFLQAHGWTSQVQLNNDFEASSPLHLSGASVADVLSQLLPPLGINAELDPARQMAVVH